MRLDKGGRKTGKTAGWGGDRKRIIALVTIIAVVIILVLAIGIVQHTGKGDRGEGDGGGSSSKPVPEDPRRSATAWLTKLMGKTSAKFGPDMFNGENAQFKQLMGGDTSFIPKDIRGSVRTGTSSDKDMTVSREALNGSAYAGLIMYSTAYKNTRDRKVTVPGYSMTSYDEATKTVYIPARAIMATNQPIQFAVTWDGHQWVLEGDPIAWDIYAMLEDSMEKDGSDGGGSK